MHFQTPCPVFAERWSGEREEPPAEPDGDDEGKGEEKSAAGDGAQPEVITRKMMLEARTPAKDKKQKKKEPSKKLGVRFT